MKQLVFLLLTCLLLSGCQEVNAWHQKLTVTVETPSGERSGSSVTRAGFNEGYSFIVGNANGSKNILEGEAVVVDLGEGKYLFALLKGMRTLARRSLDTREHTRDLRKRLMAMKDRGEVIRVPRESYPLLVTFTDINNPKTVKKVEPGRLDASFGEGYRLKSVTLEITDEPLTEGRVEKVLPCLLSGEACIPLNKSLPYNDPMRNILNSSFWQN